jgi:hypothetical protein
MREWEMHTYANVYQKPFAKPRQRCEGTINIKISKRTFADVDQIQLAQDGVM